MAVAASAPSASGFATTTNSRLVGQHFVLASPGYDQRSPCPGRVREPGCPRPLGRQRGGRSVRQAILWDRRGNFAALTEDQDNRPPDKRRPSPEATSTEKSSGRSREKDGLLGFQSGRVAAKPDRHRARFRAMVGARAVDDHDPLPRRHPRAAGDRNISHQTKLGHTTFHLCAGGCRHASGAAFAAPRGLRQSCGLHTSYRCGHPGAGIAAGRSATGRRSLVRRGRARSTADDEQCGEQQSKDPAHCFKLPDSGP